MITKIKKSFELAKKTYDEDYVGHHWSDYFSNKNFIDKINLNNLKKFRSIDHCMSSGLDDRGNYFETIDAFFNLLKKYNFNSCQALLEADCGAPPHIEVANLKLNYNDIFIINYALSIHDLFLKEKLSPQLIVEIGSGHGSLASKLKTLFKSSKVILIDLAEAGSLATYYLNETHPNAKILTYYDYTELVKNNGELNINDIDFDFAIMPPHCIELIAQNKVDLYINTRSMMEMRASTIAEYFSAIHRTIKVGGIFFNVNRYTKSTSGDDVQLRKYPYDNFWDVINSEKSFLQPHIHQISTKRTFKPKKSISEVLKNLPDSEYIRAKKMTSDKRAIKFRRRVFNIITYPLYSLIKTKMGLKIVKKLFLISTSG
jgi:hypothetical protein